MQKVEMFTDGACKGDKSGGWGVLLVCRGVEKELYGGKVDTTNNAMELTAVLEGLRALKKPCDVHLVTDSLYVLKGATEWFPNWVKNGWKTSGGKQVKNKDLWIVLDEEVGNHDITWDWVQGHTGHEGNERADALANKGVEEIRCKQ